MLIGPIGWWPVHCTVCTCSTNIQRAVHLLYNVAGLMVPAHGGSRGHDVPRERAHGIVPFHLKHQPFDELVSSANQGSEGLHFIDQEVQCGSGLFG